jgi:hypothetical protein
MDKPHHKRRKDIYLQKIALPAEAKKKGEAFSAWVR